VCKKSFSKTAIAFGVAFTLQVSQSLADPLGAGTGSVFRLGPDAKYQEGCFDPCLCPILNEQPVMGTMKLVYAGFISGLHVYGVQDVNWRVPGFNDLRILGSGVYRIGSPTPILVMQQRMELDLTVGGDPPQHFDRGWVPWNQNTPGSIDITVSINGMYCWDRVIRVAASRVADSEVLRYTLLEGATYHHDCFGNCGCHIENPRPMIGDFALVFLSDNSLFRDYSVVDVQWLALSPVMNAGTPLNGTGFYRIGGEVAIQHQLELDLVVGDEPRTHFDSGWIGGGGEFPRIDIRVTMNNYGCIDTELHVLAAPSGEVCGGITGQPCSDPNEFCKLPIGSCCCDFQGVCTPIPGGCPAHIDPVCGCDGVTYSNECEADRAGVSVDYYGPCGEVCGGITGQPCDDPNEFCKLPPGSCCCDFQGICTPIPNGCPDVWDPVCGCDGQTYGNECEADMAAVSVDHQGPCEQVCGGIAGIPCNNPGEFCKLPIGSCCCDFQGLCTPIPTGCPDVWDPVCGCDGVTYGNECEADAAAISIDHTGPCQPNCAATRVLGSAANVTYCPGNTVLVRIQLNPPNSTAAIALEDSPPAGWTVGNITDGGSYDTVHHKVKWAFLSPPFPAQVSYSATPSNDTAGPKCFTGTISIDGANQIICGQSCLGPCCPYMAADTPRAACAGCPVTDCNDCNASVCYDGRISLCELIGYACSWILGCHDDISGVTRAAYIWRHGECYCWDDANGNWYPSGCDGAASVCCGGHGASSDNPHAPGKRSSHPDTVSGAIRPIGNDRYGKMSEYEVTVELRAPAGSSAAALELRVAKTWTVTSVSDGGAWDEVHQKVKWGPFFDDRTRTVTMTVRIPALHERVPGAQRLRPPPNPKLSLRGTVSIDGENRTIVIGR